MTSSNSVQLMVNGQTITIEGRDALMPLGNFLRERRGLTGTKLLCCVGDCGVCSVIVGTPNGDAMSYQPVNSCIVPLAQLHGKHVVTVEALAEDGQPNALQQAMIEGHASQCGFCTPGFVCALSSLCNEQSEGRLSQAKLVTGLANNLCRCTGYTPIMTTGAEINVRDVPPVSERYSDSLVLHSLAQCHRDSLELSGGKETILSPPTLEEALQVRKEFPDAKVIAGGTDVGVQLNAGRVESTVFLDLNRVDELRTLELDESRTLTMGARATWTQVLDLLSREELLPSFQAILERFGGPQIRHVATVGGNIVNASPSADSVPLFMICNADLELRSEDDRRVVPITDFYLGDKQFDLRRDELLTSVSMRVPGEDELVGLVKVSQREQLDIAIFTGAVRMRVVDGTIEEVALSMGAVASKVLRLPGTEEFLCGKPFSVETMEAARPTIQTEISPITDKRGSERYRRSLAGNFLCKFVLENSPREPALV